MRMAQAPPLPAAARYRHEALLYSGLDEFLDATTSFIRRAVRRRDPVLVVVSGYKIELLRRRLGADADSAEFADMAAVGANPALIIAAWQAFVAAHAGSGGSASRCTRSARPWNWPNASSMRRC